MIKGYCEPLFTSKLDNVEEVDKFLETYSLTKLNHEEMEKAEQGRFSPLHGEDGVSRQIPPKEESPGSSLVIFTEHLTPQILPEIEVEGTFPDSCYKEIPHLLKKKKLDKNTARKESYRPTLLMDIDVQFFNRLLAD